MALPRSSLRDRLALSIALIAAWSGSAAAARIEGQIYDAVTGTPVRGVAVSLFYDAEDATEPGQLVPAAILGAGQQGQTTRTDGDYRFDAPDGRRYRLAVDASRRSYSFPSSRIPARSGFAVVDAQGQVAEGGYYLRFAPPVGQDIRGNDVAIDPLASVIDFAVRADRAEASTGDLIHFTVTAVNRSQRDFSIADGRGLFIVDAPARGLVYLAGQASARIERDGSATLLQVGSGFEARPQGSIRLIRYGPFDLPRDATLTLHYQVTVGVDTRPGRNHSRTALRDAGGVNLVAPVTTTVRVVADAVLETGVVLGRVYCDTDGDGRHDAGEPGRFGARVFASTGSYAVTDSAGLYHLSRLRGGSHVVKLDQATLAGGQARGDATELIRLGDGLSARVDFPVVCADVEVGPGHPRFRMLGPGAPPPAPGPVGEAEPAILHGDVVRLSLNLNGAPVALPSAAITSPADRNPPPPPAAGWTPPLAWSTAVAGGSAARWTLTIARIDAGALQPVRTLAGQGAVPPSIGWDGLASDGRPVAADALYAAQLTVYFADGAEAASARGVLGVGFGRSPPPEQLVWRGPLVAGTAARPQPTAQLTEQLTALAARLGPADRVTIEAHGDGTGDDMAMVARTQREANAAAALLVAAGVSADRVTARGRGSMDPVDRAGTPAARTANRRLVIEILRPPSPSAGAAIPLVHERAASAMIDGRPVALDDRGQFRVPLRTPHAAVDIEATDGRRAALVLSAGVRPEISTSPTSISIDLRTSTITAGTTTLPATLLTLAVRPTSAGPPFTLELGAGFTPAWWRVEARCGEAAWAAVANGTGAPPASTTWAGAAGAVCAARLVAGTTEGWLGYSAPAPIAVPVPTAAADLRFTGVLFAGSGAATAALQARLGELATRAGERVGERYRIVVTVAVDRRRPATDREMRLAAAAAQLSASLRRLGVAGARFDVGTAQGVADSVVVTMLTPPAVAPVVASEPTLHIDGVAQAFAGGKAVVTVTRPGGAAILIDVSDAGGRRAVYAVTAPHTPQPSPHTPQPSPHTPQPSPHTPQPSPHTPQPSPPHPNPPPAGGGGSESRLPSVSASAPIMRLRVAVPPEGTTVQTDELAVTGRGEPGTRVVLHAGGEHRALRVGADGRFAALVPIAPGARQLKLDAVDGDGNAATLRWPIDAAPESTFAVGLIEGIAATAWTARGWLADAAWMDGMTEHSAVGAGPLVLHGRAVAYLRARRHTAALGEVSITGHIDTAHPSGSGAFHDDPLDGNPTTGDPPVWGDSATEVRDVNTRGKAYLRVESPNLRAVLGSLHTDLSTGHLFRYDRTVDGARIDVDTGPAPGHRLTVRAFGTRDLDGLARDVNWFRATGGSLYYLRHRLVVEGSEQVRAVVRERDTGLVIADRLLERNHDYSIDWGGGRILLTEPIASTAGAGWVIHDLETSTTPADGNPVYLEVSYEHADPSAGDRAAGASVREQWRGLSIGAGVAGENRSAAADHLHWGVNAAARTGRGSAVTVELAGSRAGDGADTLSADGGLTFLDLDHLADAAGADRGTALGWRITGELRGADLGRHRLLARTRASILVQDLDRDFSGGGTLLEQGRRKAVGLIVHELSTTDQLTLRHIAEIAHLPQVGPSAADVAANPEPFALDERATYMTTLQWARARGPFTVRVEAMHQRLSSTAALATGAPVIDSRRLGVGAAAGWRRSRALLLRASQQVQVGIRDHDPQLDPIDTRAAGGSDSAGAGIITGVGADVGLTRDLTLTTDWLQAWNGDSAVQLGLRSGLSPTGSMYLHQRVGGRDGRFVATTIVGAEDRLGTTGGRTYGEYQLENGALGQRNRAVLGLGHRWPVAAGVRMAGGFEHQHVFGGYLPDGTPVGDLQRDVIYAALELTRFERLRAGARVELRFDNGPPFTGADDFPIAEDPRPQVGPGRFADHGGVAPGAPLVLAHGKVFQLVAGAGAAVRLVHGLTLIGRGRLAETERDAEHIGTVARWRELTSGLAWRPSDRDWLDLLARYSWVRSWRPPGEDGPALDENAHVYALLALADLPHRISLSGKLAFKRSEAATTLLDGVRMDTGVDALLWLVRAAYRLRGRWDAAVELRWLGLDTPGGRESRLGTLVEAGYRVNRLVRLGAGYDLGHFSSDELGDLQRDSHGLFVRVTGQY